MTPSNQLLVEKAWSSISRRPAVWVWIVALCVSSCFDAVCAQSVPRRSSEPESSQDSAGNEIEVVVPAAGGVVRWHDVADSIAETLTLDATSVRQMFPTGSIDLRSDGVMIMLLGIDLAFGDSLSCEIIRDQTTGSALRLRCKRDAFASTPRAAKRKEISLSEISLSIDDDWEARSDKPLVVCIHGLKSSPETFDEFRELLRSERYATAAIGYDDDQPIQRSAKQISDVVNRRIGTSRNSSLRIALVGHSMGGLIAREWIENSQIDCRIVSHVFTVATPHLGSNWASLPPMLNLVSGDELSASSLMDVLLHQPTSRGLRDLQPGSEQLKIMAARRRNESVLYTNVVGTGSPADQSDVDALRDTLTELDRDGSVIRLIRPRIRPLLEEFDELIEGKGDGVVSVKNATLTGVDHFVSVPLAHGQMFRSTKGLSPHPVWRAVLDGLSREK